MAFVPSEKTNAQFTCRLSPGLKEEEEERSSAISSPQELQKACSVGNINSKIEEDTSAVTTDRRNEEEEDAAADLEEQNEAGKQVIQPSPGTDSRPQQPGSSMPCEDDSHVASKVQPSAPEADPELEPDPDELDGDPHGGAYPCQHCERHFSTRQGLERHVHIHAVTAQQTQLFKCRYCNKAFGSQVGRRRHERRHESGAKKRPGSLGGTAPLLSPATQTDGSSPDCTSPAGHYIAIGSQFTAGPLHNAELQRKELGPHGDRAFIFDENGESKELHPCKYCNKAFGTHTNMRRHQRRIHERHLLPKGVRRKGMLLQEASAQQLPGESPGTSPPPVYVPSADTEDEADRDDYAIDISKNISENLSFYIDGKILSTSSASGCEVIEVDSRSAALFGLDTVILNSAQISQALKVEGRISAAKQVANISQPVKRRTSTPPLVPTLKVETEPASLTASSSSPASLLLRGSYQAAPDSCAFQREKTVYLSPKLKQLLQTQDVQKSAAVLTESHRLTSPLTAASLQGAGASSRFKRRTSSPPSSPQLSPQGSKAEAVSSYSLKVPKLEGQSTSLLQDREDGDSSVPGNNVQVQAANNGGNSCNQQPLDLSYSVRRSEASTKVSADSALDLSFQRKSSADPETKGAPAPKKRKPNTSMLEKVLMNEYVGLSLPGDEGLALANPHTFHPRSPKMASESAQPSPPSLTPVTFNPSSPGSSSVTSPTPPPPVLPTIPSPPTMPSSPLSQPSDSSALRQLPVLSPKMSPRSVEQKSDSEEGLSTEENKDEGQSDTPQPPESPKSPLNVSASSDVPQPVLPDAPSTEDRVPTEVSDSLPNDKTNQNLDSEAEKSLPDVSPHSESSSSSPGVSDDSQPQTQIKEEAEPSSVDELAQNGGVESSPSSDLDRTSKKPLEEDGVDPTYCKTFVCNVCERPFGAIKDLSGHITEHAADWPFKCEFCVQLFGDAPALLAHRTTLHGVGRIFVCSACSKEFAFLCNLQQHQKDLHPNESCSHTTVESGKLRPQNYTDPSAAKEESGPPSPAPQTTDEAGQEGANLAKEETDVNGNHAEDPNEELYTTIKIMASEGSKPKGPDVRLGLNQHYPSYKPPPFPYHSRTHAASVASATNFTTHNIPQTFSTAIRCTKCGNSFDNMPELHQHILACANASDKKRYTPKKNPIPLKQIVKSPNGALSPTAAAAAQSAFRRMGQPKRLNFNQETGKTKMSALSKKKNQLVQKAISQKNKVSTFSKKVTVKVEQEQPSNVCPHCSREFTYPASLSKHMAISCPMKPVVKKGKKKEAEKNMTLRKKASDGETVQAETDAKPLGKTRARSLGTTDPDTALQNKGKAATGRVKRPASLPAPAAASKKSKKGQDTSSPSTPDAPGESAQQRATARMQRVGKEAAPKRSAEAKAAAAGQQLKKEERFSLRPRERASGPVTRSLQMSSAAPPAEVKSEEPQFQEPKETQVRRKHQKLGFYTCNKQVKCRVSCVFQQVLIK